MKKNVFKIFSVMGLIAIFIACSNEWEDNQSSIPNNVELEMPEMFKIVGEEHNEALDYTYDSFKDYYVKTATRGYIDSMILLNREEYTFLGEKAAFEYCAKLHGTKMDLSNDEDDITLNGTMQYYVHRICSALKESQNDSKKLLENLNQINRDAGEELSEMDAAAIYAGTSTCYHSFLYWNENYMKWVIALNEPKLLTLYDNEELKHFDYINGGFVSPKMNTLTRNWLQDAWSDLGETWDDIGETVNEWWNDTIQQGIVEADLGGAVRGAISGGLKGKTLQAAGIGAVSKGATKSVTEAIKSWRKNK